MAGLSPRTVGQRLADLKRIGVVDIVTPALKSPCTYKLLPFGNGCATFGNGCRALSSDCATFGNLEAPPLPTSEEKKEKKVLTLTGEPEKQVSKARALDLAEVQAFVASEGLPVSDADYFWNKCEGNGWKNGGNSIKDWRATVRSWKAASYLPSQKARTQNAINNSNSQQHAPRVAGTLNEGRAGQYASVGKRPGKV